MTLSEELQWRGFVNQTTYKDLTELDKGPVAFYFGVDPSADSMTIGNLAAAMMVKCFIKHGHKATLLVGGATGMIGDPDGKKEARSLKALDDIARNKAAIAAQYQTVFEGMEFNVVDNYDWFKDLGYLDFLRDVGMHVPMSAMLGREFVQSRLGEDGSGINYAEFSYALIQGYDFVHLNREYGVTLQLCGADQWGNSIAGVDLIRRINGAEAHIYSTPLVINKSTGVKFGKSESGAIWLDPAKTSPSDFYQFWINLDDDGLEYYFKIYTELDKATIDAIIAEHVQDPRKRYGQIRLAEEVTRLVHGQGAVTTVQNVTAYLTGILHVGQASSDELTVLREQIKAVAVEHTEASLVDVLTDSGLAASKSEARRLMQDNAVYINGQRATTETLQPEDFTNGRALVRRGKSLKDTALVYITER